MPTRPQDRIRQLLPITDVNGVAILVKTFHLLNVEERFADIATIVGLLAAFGLIFMASENAPAFVDTASLLIVVAGSIAVVMARCSLGEFLGAMGVMGKAFSRKIDDPVELITQIVELANIARKDGMIALEGQDIANPFLAKAVSMLVDGTDGEIIKSSLNRDNDMMKLRHEMARRFLVPGAKSRPRWA